jgi:2-keto-4-pentenoate hydratase/2-oxohepta-3-ene-1,7-dioic acid hydratase in catechol pathway
MKLIRFAVGGSVRHGVLENGEIRAIDGCIFGEFAVTEQKYPLAQVKVLAPVQPTNLIAVGKSYRKHIDEMAARQGAAPDYPANPIIFFEAPGSIVGSGETIILPPEKKYPHVDLEGELAIVIGKKAKQVRKEDALDYVLGYTIANDVSARGLPDVGGLWGIGLSKSLDTFNPLGPVIETEIENPNNLRLVTRVNGEIAQDSNTEDMIFTVEDYVSYCSSRLTLHPGDVIMTGTPAGVRPLKDGDRVEVAIESIGTLVNPVRREK